MHETCQVVIQDNESTRSCSRNCGAPAVASMPVLNSSGKGYRMFFCIKHLKKMEAPTAKRYPTHNKGE